MEVEKTYAEYEKDLDATFKEAHRSGAQDIFLVEDERPAFRIKGVITKMSHLPRWDIETFNTLIHLVMGDDSDDDKSAMSPEQLEKWKVSKRTDIFEKLVKEYDGSYDFNLSYGKNHLRCHVYSAFPKGTKAAKLRNIQAVMNVRVVPHDMPKLETLNLPDISTIFTKSSGLLLVSGRAGDGKSTTVAGIVDEFNGATDKHRIILTLEDPIEFVHKNANAWVIQRRIRQNVPSYEKATEDAMREDANIVVIGELRTVEGMHNALRLAEIGKLVIATIHANSVGDTIERYVNEFPGEEQDKVRTRLVENLLGIIHQNLITEDGEQYPLVSMLLVDNNDIRDRLRGNKERDKIEKAMRRMDSRYALTREDGLNLLVKKGILPEREKYKYL